LIYCALSGWGQEGVYAQRSGHDLNYVSIAGMTGEVNTPQPFGGQIADIGGAYAAVGAICAALFGRERGGTGAFIDCSLFDAALPFFAATWVEAVTRASSGEPHGRLTGKLACYNIYETRDNEYVALGALEPKFWENFCRSIERPDLIADYDAAPRQRYLLLELQEIFSMKTAAEWEALLDEMDCCFSRVNNATTVADHPQVQARRALGVRDDGVPWMRSPFRFEGDLPMIGDSPGYGAHTHAVMREAGYTDAEIDILVKSEAVQG
jgi:alpha-methylacyl-CoA racemase